MFYSGQLCLEKVESTSVKFFSSMNFKMFVFCRGIMRQRYLMHLVGVELLELLEILPLAAW